MLPELASSLRALDAARESFLVRVRGVSDAQRRYRAAPGSWSMIEVTEHLVLAEEKSLLGMLKGPAPGVTVTPMARARMVMVRIVMRTSIRLKVPVSRVVPQGDATLPELEARWSAARRGLEDAIEPVAIEGAGDARFRHPIAGWVTAKEGVAFLAEHIGHHARQLERIRRTPGFPSP